MLWLQLQKFQFQFLISIPVFSIPISFSIPSIFHSNSGIEISWAAIPIPELNWPQPWWRCGSLSTLARGINLLANCCLAVLSHYLNQCWLIIKHDQTFTLVTVTGSSQAPINWLRASDAYMSVKHTNIAADNGLSLGWHQAITWSKAGILLIGPFIEILIKIYTFSFKKLHLQMLSGKWQPFCLGLNMC